MTFEQLGNCQRFSNWEIASYGDGVDQGDDVDDPDYVAYTFTDLGAGELHRTCTAPVSLCTRTSTGQPGRLPARGPTDVEPGGAHFSVMHTGQPGPSSRGGDTAPGEGVPAAPPAGATTLGTGAAPRYARFPADLRHRAASSRAGRSSPSRRSPTVPRPSAVRHRPVPGVRHMAQTA
jgi:hypothetical protein